MTGLRFKDVVGSIEPDSLSLRKFIYAWFLPEDLIVLDKTPEDGPKSFMTIPAKELYANAEAALELKSEAGVKNNLYLCLNPAKREIPDGSPTRKEAGIAKLNGFFADLDVKEGGFTSQEDILLYLKTLAVRPTSIVESGSGGIHATWRATGEVTQEDYKGWIDYLQSKAPNGVQIDRLINMDRIFRLPGSVRWPKAGEKHAVVRLIGGTGEATDVQTFRELYKEPHAQKQQLRNSVKNRERELYRRSRSELPKYLRGPNTKATEKAFEQKIESLPWERILGPAGWTQGHSSNDGTRQWVRPGSSQKSATTDWTNPETGLVSGVMSLLSSSPDSGLLDLKEADVPLTKYRVLLRLRYNDDFQKLFIDNLKGEFD